MPPSQSLRVATVTVVIDADGPLAAADDDFAILAREVEGGEEDLGWEVFGGGGLGVEGEGEGGGFQVKAVRSHVACCEYGGWADVSLGGAEAGFAVWVGCGGGGLWGY